MIALALAHGKSLVGSTKWRGNGLNRRAFDHEVVK